MQSYILTCSGLKRDNLGQFRILRGGELISASPVPLGGGRVSCGPRFHQEDKSTSLHTAQLDLPLQKCWESAKPFPDIHLEIQFRQVVVGGLGGLGGVSPLGQK